MIGLGYFRWYWRGAVTEAATLIEDGDDWYGGVSLPAFSAGLLAVSLISNPLSSQVTNVANDEIVSVPQEEYQAPLLSPLSTDNYVADHWRYEQNEIVPQVVVTVVEEEYWLVLQSSYPDNKVPAAWSWEQNEIVSRYDEDYWIPLGKLSLDNKVVDHWRFEQNEIVSRPNDDYWLVLNKLSLDNVVAEHWKWEQDEIVSCPNDDYLLSLGKLSLDNIYPDAWKWEQNDVIVIATTPNEDYWLQLNRLIANNIVPGHWVWEQNEVIRRFIPDEDFYIPPRMKIEVPVLLRFAQDEIVQAAPRQDEDYWFNPVAPYYPNNRGIDRWLWEQYESIPIGAHVPLTSSDIIAFASVSRPLDDTSICGGSIDPTIRPVFLQIASDDNLEAISSSASDTGQLSIVGRSTDGQLISSTITLNGVTTVIDLTVYKLIFSVQYATTAVGTIIVRRSPGGAVVCVIPSGERGVSAMFKGSSSEISEVKRYEKFFWKNVHSATTMINALARLAADPEARIKQGISTATNDALTVTNRRIAPPGIVFVDDNVDQSIPGGGILPPSSAIGVWVELDLPAQDVGHKSTFTMRISGES